MANRQNRRARFQQDQYQEELFRRLLREGKARFLIQKEEKKREKHIYRQSKVLFKYGVPYQIAAHPWYRRVIKGFFTYKSAFIGRLENFDWNRALEIEGPRADAVSKLFKPLIRHLFVRYPIPAFMDLAFIRLQHEYIPWAIAMGQGANIRKCQGLPFPLTKKMATFFLGGERQFSIYQNLRRAQVLGLGGSIALARAVCKSRLGDEENDIRKPHHEEFWQRVIQWLIRHEPISLEEVNLLIWYIEKLKFRPRRRMSREGILSLESIPKPDFDVKGRNFLRFLDEARSAWALLNSQRSFLVNSIYDRVGDYSETRPGGQNIRIFPLLNAEMIQEEGRIMRHCVGDYLDACENGFSSIWSMVQEKQGKPTKRLLTIEISDYLEVEQLRGFANRDPYKEEKAIVKRWARKEKLSFPSYL